MQQKFRWSHYLCNFSLSIFLAFGMPLQTMAQKQRPPVNKLTEQQKIIHLLERTTFGIRPGEIERITQLGWEKYLEQQLNPSAINDDLLAQKLQPLTTLTMSSQEIAKIYDPPAQVLVQLREKIQNQNGTTADKMEPSETPQKKIADDLNDPAKRREYAKALADMGYKPRQIPVTELQQGKIIRAVYSERQLQEVLTDFWFNHFNVYAQKGPDRILLTAYERDTIRPNVFGKFADLLLATAQSPAMLFYLDNWMSTAPNAQFPNADRLQQMRQNRNPSGAANPKFNRPGQITNELRAMRQQENQTRTMEEKMTPPQQPANKRTRGINENYAREIMELHTLGVDGGYTQKDVQEVARCFTGWTLRQPRSGGGFYFAPFMHDNGEKFVLGQKIPAGGGQADGAAVIKILAQHPATAKFIATKLVRKFVSDNPPAALVDNLAKVYLKTDGDLREMYKTLFKAPEFWAPENYRAKIKTPFEMTVSAVRALGADTNGAPAFHKWMQQMGEGLFLAQPPTGYADTAETWVNTGALLERMNFALALSSNRIFGTRINFANELATAKPAVVADHFIKQILHDNISPQTRATLDKTLNDPNIADKNGTDVAKIAGLILGSPEFQRQ